MQDDTAALLASRLPISTTDFVALHQARGRTLELMGQYDEAKEAYRSIPSDKRARSRRLCWAHSSRLPPFRPFPTRRRIWMPL